MNEKAKELGLNNTHFVTPHGLDDPEHYTTAYELACLTDVALQNTKFAQIVNTKVQTITINGQSRSIHNTNELLGNLNGVYGVKTGFTNNAGRCLVTSTKRNDLDFITVVIGEDTKKQRTQDSIKLIEYASSHFQQVNLQNKAIEEFERWKQVNQKRIEVVKGNTDCAEFILGMLPNQITTIKTNEIDQIKYEIIMMNSLIAPVMENQKIGTMTIRLNENIIGQIDILNAKEIRKKEITDYMKQLLNQIWNIPKIV